jgi:hypothetical protein
MLPSEIWRHVVWYIVANVSEETYTMKGTRFSETVVMIYQSIFVK